MERPTLSGWTGPAAEAKPEPFALEARYFTEVRLLQREVDVVVEGIDKYGTCKYRCTHVMFICLRVLCDESLPLMPCSALSVYGTVLHPKGNISMELLKCGLARVVDYSIAYASRDNALQVCSSRNLGEKAHARSLAPDLIGVPSDVIYPCSTASLSERRRGSSSRSGRATCPHRLRPAATGSTPPPSSRYVD